MDSSGPLRAAKYLDDPQAWQGDGHSRWRWVSKQDDFESRLYGLPILNLHLELLDTGEDWLASEGLHGAQLSHRLEAILQQFLERTPWSNAYVAAKVVPDEPLCKLLADARFEQVEHRCLYKSKVTDLQISEDRPNETLKYHSLAEVAVNQRDRVREQILEICNEGFQRGYSRHFADGFLLQRAPGLTYIREVMKLNFERVPPHLFLLALERNADRLCGFSILAERPGLEQEQYTQLLSAVRKGYRGKGVYAGLPRLLTEILPKGAQLINVTHVENHAMKRAYQDTGRQPYADTLVLRRVFGFAADSESR